MTIETQIRERAEAGDGSFAVAWSILQLANAICALGTGNATTEMGALEYVASHLGERIDAAATQIVEAIQQF